LNQAHIEFGWTLWIQMILAGIHFLGGEDSDPFAIGSIRANFDRWAPERRSGGLDVRRHVSDNGELG